MTYRDDRDADRARIESLEAELAGANKRIAELEGRREQALVLASSGALAAASDPHGGSARRWLGAPLELRLSHEFAGAYPTDRFEELVERIREVVRDPGRTEILKSSLTWSSSTGPKAIGPFLIATVSVREGTTRLTISDRLGQAVGAIYGGVGGGVGGGLVFAPIALGVVLAPVLAPLLGAVWLGGTWWGCRRLYRGIAKRRAEQMQRVFDALVEEIGRALVKQA